MGYFTITVTLSGATPRALPACCSACTRLTRRREGQTTVYNCYRHLLFPTQKLACKFQLLNQKGTTPMSQAQTLKDDPVVVQAAPIQAQTPARTPIDRSTVIGLVATIMIAKIDAQESFTAYDLTTELRAAHADLEIPHNIVRDCMAASWNTVNLDRAIDHGLPGNPWRYSVSGQDSTTDPTVAVTDSTGDYDVKWG